MYAVMLLCRAGRIEIDIRDQPWCHQLYHVITWTVEDDAELARQVAAGFRRDNSREVLDAWLEPWHARTWGRDRGYWTDSDGLIRAPSRVFEAERRMSSVLEREVREEI